MSAPARECHTPETVKDYFFDVDEGGRWNGKIVIGIQFDQANEKFGDGTLGRNYLFEGSMSHCYFASPEQVTHLGSELDDELYFSPD